MPNLNGAKSQLQPTTKICFLGFIIDSISMELLLPEDKLQKIISACLTLVSNNNPSVRGVTHVTGLLVSAFPAVNYCPRRVLAQRPKPEEAL